MQGLSEPTSRMKYVLDLRSLTEPIKNAQRERRRDHLQFCLWQVGLASGALVLLLSARQDVAAFDNWAAKILYVLSVLGFIGSIILATWTYRWCLLHSLRNELDTVREVERLLALAIPDGLGGALSTEQQGVLQDYRDTLKQRLDDDRRTDERIMVLIARQDTLLNVAFIFLFCLVGQVALVTALR